jgi:hypothetical protein
LDDESFLASPLHDVDYLGVMISASPDNGDVTLYLKIATNEQEGFGAPIKSRLATLIFEDCRRVLPNILGTNRRREVISTWAIIANSPLIEELVKKGLAKAMRDQKHFHLEFSGGSIIDVLAKGVVVSEGEE